MLIASPVLLIVIFSILIYRLNFFKLSVNSKLIMLAFFVKLIFTFGLIGVYTFYYSDRSTADIYKYYDDAVILYDEMSGSPNNYVRMITGIGDTGPSFTKAYNKCNYWYKEFDYRLYNDNRTIIRFNALFIPLIGKNIYALSVLLMFFSFIGLVCIYKFFETGWKNNKYLLYVSIFYLPSVLFWTSGLLKEGLLMFSLGVLLYGMQGLVRKFRLVHLLLTLGSLGMLLITKYYVLGIILPLTAAYIIVAKFSLKAWKVYFTAGIGAGGLVILNHYFLHLFPLVKTIAQKRNDFIVFANSLDSVGSLLHLEKLNGTVIDMLFKTPQALYNSFLEPNILSANSILSLMAAVENSLLLFIAIVAILFRKRTPVSNEIYFSFCFTIALFWLSGIITPVAGALVRYKTPALPFLAIVLIYFIDTEKLKSFFYRFRIR